MARKSAAVKAAYVTSAGVMVAAIFGTVLPRWSCDNPRPTQVSPTNYINRPPRPLELTYSVIGLHNHAGEWKKVPLRDGAALDSGDCFKIEFMTNEECFVYVLLSGSGGIAQCLFPHEEIGFDNHVRGDLPYTVPGGGNWYYLDDVPGVETIYIVVCCEPMSNIAGLLKKMEQADTYKQLELSEDIRCGINDIQTRGSRGVSDIRPGPRWDLVHDGNIVETVTEVVRGTGSIVKVVSFEHK